MFWLMATALLLAAALFVAVPLLRAAARAAPAADGGATVRALYRDRVAELDAEMEAGRLDAAMRAEVEAELGANLLDDYRELDRAGDAPGGGRDGGRLLGWLLAVLLPAVGLWVYWIVGEPGADEVAGAAVVLQLDPDAERGELRAWQVRLAQRVARQPGDAQSWYLLGSARLQLAEFAAAAEAFERADAVTGPDPVIDLYWLQARYLAADGRLDATTREIAQRILARRDNHPLVLEMFAIDAYRRGEFRAAVEHLNRALNNDLSHPQFMTLLAGLQQARARMGDLSPSVDVDVSAAGEAPRDALLFVIARPPGGGMPYAVVRRPAGLLPVSVRLDDTVSMNPQLPLSAAPAIEVVVRLSRSGTPAAAPGDWEWRSDPMTLSDLSAPVQLRATLEPPSAVPGAGH